MYIFLICWYIGQAFTNWFCYLNQNLIILVSVDWFGMISLGRPRKVIENCIISHFCLVLLVEWWWGMITVYHAMWNHVFDAFTFLMLDCGMILYKSMVSRNWGPPSCIIWVFSCYLLEQALEATNWQFSIFLFWYPDGPILANTTKRDNKTEKIKC